VLLVFRFICLAPGRDAFALVLAILFIVIFSVGFPAFVTIKLVTTKAKDVFAYDSRIRYGALWEQLKYKKIWFTAVIFWKRSIIAAIIGILAAGQEGIISLIISIIITLAYAIFFMIPNVDPFLDSTTKITELVAALADIISFGLAIAFTVSYTDQNHVYTIIIAVVQYLSWLTAIICYVIQWLRMENVNTLGQLISGGN